MNTVTAGDLDRPLKQSCIPIPVGKWAGSDLVFGVQQKWLAAHTAKKGTGTFAAAKH